MNVVSYLEKILGTCNIIDLDCIKNFWICQKQSVLLNTKTTISTDVEILIQHHNIKTLEIKYAEEGEILTTFNDVVVVFLRNVFLDL